MFDNLFGSGETKEKVRDLEKKLEEKSARLEDLKEKVENMESDLEKERNRAKEAITKKQRVDKELKDTKQKIQTLKDKLSKLKDEEQKERIFKRVIDFSRQEALVFLDELKSFKTERNSLKTYYFSDPEDVELDEVARAAKNIDSETGYVSFQDKLGLFSFILIPPFPVEKNFFREDQFHVEQIEEILESDFKVLFLSFHAGKSCAGLMSGPEINDFKIIRSSVKNKHSKGGFSQGRFERGREEQIHDHIGDILDYLEDLDYDLDFIVLDGNDRIIGEIISDLPFDSPVISRNLGIGEISESNSEEFAEKIWSTRIYIM